MPEINSNVARLNTSEGEATRSVYSVLYPTLTAGEFYKVTLDAKTRQLTLQFVDAGGVAITPFARKISLNLDDLDPADPLDDHFDIEAKFRDVPGSDDGQGNPIKVLSTAPFSGGSTGAEMFLLKSTSGDYLACHPYDGTTESTTNVLIAKPPELRASVMSFRYGPGSNQIVNYGYTTDTQRVATWEGGLYSAIQLVTPAYQVNHLIFAIKANATGIAGVTYIELNQGRAWARAFML